MLSGGIDSVYLLKKLLIETNENIYAHHLHLINGEGKQIERYKLESIAVRKVVPYMKKNFRDFHYTESTIDVKQIMNLLSMPKQMKKRNRESTIYFNDNIYLYFVGAMLAKVTDAENLAFGNCLEDWEVNSNIPEHYSLENRQIHIRKNILKAVSYPEKVPNANIYQASSDVVSKRMQIEKRPVDKSTELKIQLVSKKENINYLGKELMDMVWYCREPQKENEQIIVCNTCHSCREVNNAMEIN